MWIYNASCVGVTRAARSNAPESARGPPSGGVGASRSQARCSTQTWRSGVFERARATTEGGKLKLHVKLNDRGYPGCVYELEYDRENDVMVGTYFQAAMRHPNRFPLS